MNTSGMGFTMTQSCCLAVVYASTNGYDTNMLHLLVLFPLILFSNPCMHACITEDQGILPLDLNALVSQVGGGHIRRLARYNLIG